MAGSLPKRDADLDIANPNASESESGHEEHYAPTKLDRAVLEDEEQEQRLLLGHSLNGRGAESSPQRYQDSDRRERRKERRRQKRSEKRRRRHDKDEDGELMYEMEEGGSKDDTGSQSSSSSLEPDSIKRTSIHTKRRRRNLHIITAVAILLLFVLLTLGSYRISSKSQRRPPPASMSNGTSKFAPTTILISLDGFRADFLHRGLTPTLDAFVAEGISPKYMLPSFPSVTFPNHYTLVTGLHPESHGVVGNSFWDADIGEEFYYTKPAHSMQPKWWSGGEPLWVTAEKQGLKTAIHMWPGSEAHIQLEPTYVDKFNGTESLSRKVDRILHFLDLPHSEDVGIEGIEMRPQLIAAYVPNVDADGHKYGPNSTEIRKTISNADKMLHQLFTGIDQRNLSDIVNVVVVSDHGMATTSVDRLIQLDDLIDLDLIEHIDGWPLYGLRPKDTKDLRPLYDTLKAESLTNTYFDVYLRDEDMPERYHFSKNERIAPLWVIPKTGWAIVHKEDFDIKVAKAKGQDYSPKGLHGYDHEHPLMRAIFVARGPAFPHKPNSKLESFQNLEVYNIVCDSLGIEPKPNNGTLRLPLKPVGLHSDEVATVDSVPTDLPPTATAASTTGARTTDIKSQTPFGTSMPSNDNNPVNTDSKATENTFIVKWKQMVDKIKAAMAKLNAKIHGEKVSRAL